MAKVARTWLIFLNFLTVLLLGASTAAAVGWTEGDLGTGEAIDLLPGQATQGAGALTSITGTIFTSMDKDLYKISITSPATFSAVAAVVPTPITDTQLFLFDALGAAVYGSDDQTAVNLLSALPAGHASGPTLAGTYYLAISGKDNDPTRLGVEMFTDNALGVQTPTGAGVLDGWTATVSAFGGDYRIDLTGVTFATKISVMEGWNLALLAAGLLGMTLMMTRVRQRRAARLL